MLYLRRKAEIEVLSSTTKANRDRTASSQDPEVLNLDDCRSVAESPLILYLVAKIRKSVEDNARKIASVDDYETPTYDNHIGL